MNIVVYFKILYFESESIIWYFYNVYKLCNVYDVGVYIYVYIVGNVCYSFKYYVLGNFWWEDICEK